MADTSNNRRLVGHDGNDGRLTFALGKAIKAVAGSQKSTDSPVIAHAVRQVSGNVQGVVANQPVVVDSSIVTSANTSITKKLADEARALGTADTVRAERPALLPGDLLPAPSSVEPVTTEGAPTTTVEASKWTTRLGQIGDTIAEWWQTRPPTLSRWFIERPEAVVTAGIIFLGSFTATTAAVASRYSTPSDGSSSSTPVASPAETVTTSLWTSSSSKPEDESPLASATNTVSVVPASPIGTTIEVTPAASTEPLPQPLPTIAATAPLPTATPGVIPIKHQSPKVKTLQKPKGTPPARNYTSPRAHR